MNHCEALRQGYQRLNQMDSVHWCPLGSGAIAGNALGIDRDALASDLGFKNGPSLNAANSTGNRDAVLGEGYTDFSPPYGSKWYMFNFWENMFRYPFFDFLYAMSTIFISLSKMCEDMIIFSTPQFGFISLHQSYCTGSSLMPQVIFYSDLFCQNSKLFFIETKPRCARTNKRQIHDYDWCYEWIYDQFERSSFRRV